MKGILAIRTKAEEMAIRRKKKGQVSGGGSHEGRAGAATGKGRRSRRRGFLGPAVSLFLIIAGVYALILRRWHKKWGASGLEAAQPMPGDEIIEEPSYMTTRAVTIDARPEHVWPWLVQMGEGRGGFYSYDWIERLMGMRVSGVSEILPEFQQIEAGDIIPAGEEDIPVAAIEKNRHLVLGSAEERPWGSSTWAIALYPANGLTRLVSRVRARPKDSRRSRLLYAFLEPGMFAMERKWLLEVKRRAETSAFAEAEGHPIIPVQEQQAA